MWLLKRGNALGCVAALVLVLSGCAEAPVDGPYSAEMEAAAAAATSEFERDILSDGLISRSEYEEATSRYVECLGTNGYPASRVDQDGVYAYEITGKADGEAWDAINGECRLETVEIIEPLYVDSVVNPENKDFFDLVISCLKAHDLVEPTFSKEDFPGDGETPPWDPADPEVSACMSRPVE